MTQNQNQTDTARAQFLGAGFIAAALAAANLTAAHQVQLYLVGGPVRDLLRGTSPRDLDLLATFSGQGLSADQAAGLIEAALAAAPQGFSVARTGNDFPVLTISVATDAGAAQLELALPRQEISTGAGERDFDVLCDPHMAVEDDLARRDFTVNAAALLILRGQDVLLSQELDRTLLVDPYGADVDLQAGVLRTVGSPYERFPESPVRLLRSVRFAAALGLRYDAATWAATCELAHLAQTTEPDMIDKELRKMLKAQTFAPAAELLLRSGLLAQALPELAPMVGFAQRNPHHTKDVGEHTLDVLRALDEQAAAGCAHSALPLTRLSALLHDCGKPQTCAPNGKGWDSFIGHEDAGAEIARSLLLRTGLGTQTAERVSRLVALHMRPGHIDTRPAARRLGVAAQGDLNALLALHRADRAAHPGEDLNVVDARIASILGAQGDLSGTFGEAQLALRGDVLITLGLKGAQIGQVKRHLTQLVIDGDLPNDASALLSRARADGLIPA